MSSASTPAADDAGPARPAPSRDHRWKIALGIAVSLALLAWTLRDTDAAHILDAVRNANPLLLLLSTVVVTLTFPARAMRARWLIAASIDRHPPYRPVWLATAIGFMANNLLPLRAGEIARGFATARLVGMPVSTAFSTIAVERVFDGIVIMTMLAIGIAAPGFPDHFRLGGATLGSLAASMAALFVGALVVLGVLAHRPHRLLGLIHRLTRKVFPARAAATAIRLLDNLVTGLSVLRRPRDFIWVVIWSLVVWGLNAMSFVLAFQAFQLEVPVSAALVLQGVIALGVAVPSSPGFVGVLEYMCRITLGFYGIGVSAVAAFAISIHLAWFIPITALGLWALARAGLSFRDIRQGRPA